MRSTQSNAFDIYLADTHQIHWRQFNQMPDAQRIKIHSAWLDCDRREEYEALATRLRAQQREETLYARVWRGILAALCVMLALVVLSQTAEYWR